MKVFDDTWRCPWTMLVVVAATMTSAAATCTGGWTRDCQDRFYARYSSSTWQSREWSNCLSSYCNVQDSGCRCVNVASGADTGTVKCLGDNVWCGELVTEASCKRNSCTWEGAPASITAEPTSAPTTTCHRPFQEHELPQDKARYLLYDFSWNSQDDTLIWLEKFSDGTYQEHIVATEVKWRWPP